ncbi:CbiQ family ECF transporter T component, partial [Pseudomonas sp. 2995-1]|uniref:CbiQ family ECF transporter T component n=1 Tax=Pseudomonas sp. 2995-1 TaxID=1712679 RepID=UPI001C48E671
MLDKVIIGQYVPGGSVIHRMDPRAKLLCLMILMIFLFASSHPLSIIVAFVMTSIIFIITSVPIKFYFKGMRFIAII